MKILNDFPELCRYIYDTGLGVVHRMRHSQAIDLAIQELEIVVWKKISNRMRTYIRGNRNLIYWLGFLTPSALKDSYEYN